jgi:F0F1-type ATP synthase epsilon subunit
MIRIKVKFILVKKEEYGNTFLDQNSLATSKGEMGILEHCT